MKGMLLVVQQQKTSVMKAQSFIIPVLMAVFTNVAAQDVIYPIHAHPIEAHVLEITDDFIFYKTFDNPEGPDYRMSLGRVARIVFENGTEKIFEYYGPYGPIEHRWGHYYDRRGRIYDDRLQDYIGIRLYGSEYRKAVRQFQYGAWLTIGGAAVLVSSAIFAASTSEFNRSSESVRSNLARHGMDGKAASVTGYVVSGAVGAACVAVGIPLWVKGNRSLDRIADDYNQKYGRGHAASLDFGPTSSGLGLAFRF